MRFPYKTIPCEIGPPDNEPLLAVRLSNPQRHSPPSSRIEALVDSGASICLFHSRVARAIGIDLTLAAKGRTEGIGHEIISIFYHPVRLHLAGDAFDITAGFSEDLGTTALLGRRGFFDHYRVTFDPSDPPGFEIERVRR